MKYNIVIGLPSYNEADSIGYVTDTVDRGLTRYYRHKTALIINADSGSHDGTHRIFQKLRTKNPKEVIRVRRKGKGINMVNVLRRAQEVGADAVAFFDTDLISIKEDWVWKLVSPIFEFDGADFVLPYFKRDHYDGAVTNQFVYPLVYGLYGTDVRQPIGGEIAMGRRAVSIMLGEKFTKDALRYGIDIFFTTNAIAHGLKIVQAPMGVKTHKPSEAKLERMFLEVASAFFQAAERHRKFLESVREVRHIPHTASMEEPTHVAIHRSYFEQFAAKRGPLYAEEWAGLVRKYFGNAQELLPYFFRRALTFFDEIENLSYLDRERLVYEQAETFFREFHPVPKI